MVEEARPAVVPLHTAVGIDRDKNSMHAVRWAAEHVLAEDRFLVLVHVAARPANPTHQVTEARSEVGQDFLETNMPDIFLPYRGFCARKGIRPKEVILEDLDVSKALTDFVTANLVSNLVVGASNRMAFTRKFRNPDVPDRCLKSVPEFCAVYVIAKGKVVTVRAPKNPAPVHAIPPRRSIGAASCHSSDSSTESEGYRRSPLGRGGSRDVSPHAERSFEMPKDHRMTTRRRDWRISSGRKIYPNSLSESNDFFHRMSQTSSSDESDLSGSLEFPSTDFGDSIGSSSSSLESPTRSSSSPTNSREIEAERHRLRLELKQTMDMYSNACKEAISAKLKAREVHEWKMEEAVKFETLRQAEEAALAMVEMEKAKCRAALEAAEAAARLAELETRRRHEAELKAKRDSEDRRKAAGSLAMSCVRYRNYTIDAIEAATNKFSESLRIGEGGYGPVYKAFLDHTPAAIKILRPDASQGRKQFQQEVEVLSCIRHPNMVLLLGACPEYGCLMYEYMDNGSLEDRLFRRGNTPALPWRLRFSIAAEIATGLLFLHQTKPEPLVHRDLKPANILLDRNFVGKIGDVGLARLVPPSVADSVTQYRMTSTAGTFCYIDPEYQQTGMLGVKSDIYSLGIMLLQIITARPPMGLAHHVERAIERGAFRDILDSEVADWPEDEALAFAKLALKCAELRRRDRPDLGTVILPELNRLGSL